MRRISTAAALLFSAVLAGSAGAQTVHYSQNFDEATPNEIQAGPANYVAANDIAPGWQIQGGDAPGALILRATVDATGVGGTQALSGIWNSTGSAPGFYTWNEYTVYGIPLQPATQAVNLIRVSMDILIDGSTTNNPLNVNYQFSHDGFATPALNKTFRPTLANGVYTHVSFTLNEATGPNPDFALATAFNVQVSHGNAGFGFDQGNIVRIDNVVVETLAANADFTGDGKVDGNDFVAWQRGNGATPATDPWLSGDANADGVANTDDLAIWRQQYQVGPGSQAAAGGVPEPASAVLAACGIGLALLRRRR